MGKKTKGTNVFEKDVKKVINEISNLLYQHLKKRKHQTYSY